MNHFRRLKYTLLTLLFISIGCSKNEKIIPSPEIFLKLNNKTNIEMQVGDTINLVPKITYDIDSKYAWYYKDVLVSEEKNYAFTTKDLGTNTLTFIVSTPYGKDTLVVPVVSIIKIDFNDFELQTDTYDRGDIENYPDGFTFNNFTFPTNPLSDGYWTGFLISNIFDTKTVQNPSPFAAYNSKISKDNFLVYSQPFTPSAANIEFPKEQEHIIGSIDVANTQYSYLIMKYGVENLMRPFGGESNDTKDWCKLIIRGIDKNGAQTDTVNFFLANYTFDNRKSNYIISSWTSVNLEKLGLINQLEFSIESSITDENNNILTPQIFCLDNIKIIK